MISIKRITDTESKEYKTSEALLTASFPTDEYRALEEQRKNVESNPAFHYNILLADNTPIGLLSFWAFDGYIYIEHFATQPSLRNKGYGAMSIKQLKKEHPSIVLEVEIPTNDTTRRRIAFYQRCGLTLCEMDYMQPAYRSDSSELPMQLMSCGMDIANKFEKVKSDIYRKVYGKTV